MGNEESKFDVVLKYKSQELKECHEEKNTFQLEKAYFNLSNTVRICLLGKKAS